MSGAKTFRPVPPISEEREVPLYLGRLARNLEARDRMAIALAKLPGPPVANPHDADVDGYTQALTDWRELHPGP
jgi:hypothetical protein